MNWISLSFITSLIAGSVTAGAGPINILSMNDVAMAQQIGNGNYDVMCSNGNREIVSAADFRLGNICPNDKSSIPTGVLSIQKRSDGQFFVVCRDLTKTIATVAQILNNEVCSPNAPQPAVIENGRYSAPGTSDLLIMAIYSGYNFIALHVETPYTKGDINCSGKICTGMFPGFPQLYQFIILSPTSFELSYDNHQGAAVFTKMN